MGNKYGGFLCEKALMKFDKLFGYLHSNQAGKVRAVLHMDFGHLEISGRRYSTANLQA